jgi:hypothetical protein
MAGTLLILGVNRHGQKSHKLRTNGPGMGPRKAHDYPMTSVVIDAAGLAQLVSTLISRGYRALGPTQWDDAIVLAELESADDLPRGWGVNVGPGQYRLRRPARVVSHSSPRPRRLRRRPDDHQHATSARTGTDRVRPVVPRR